MTDNEYTYVGVLLMAASIVTYPVVKWALSVWERYIMGRRFQSLGRGGSLFLVIVIVLFTLTICLVIFMNILDHLVFLQ